MCNVCRAIGNLPWRSGITSLNLPTVGWGYAVTLFFCYNLIFAFVVVIKRRAARHEEDDVASAATKESLIPCEAA